MDRHRRLETAMPIVNRADVRDLQLASYAVGLDLSNDGKLLAIAHAGPGATITVVETGGGSIVVEAGHGAQRAWSVAFTEGGRALHYVTWDDSDQPTLWRLDLASQQREMVKAYSADDRIRHLARDKAGRYLAVIGNQIDVWNLDARRPVALVTGADKDWVLQAVFAPDSPRLFVYGVESKQVVLFDPAEDEVLQRWAAPTDIGEQVAATEDGRFVIACGRSYGGVALHDTRLGRRVDADTDGIQEFTDATEGRSFAFTSDGKYLVMVRGKVLFFELPAVTRLDPGERIHEVGARATCSATAREGRTLAFGIEEEKRVVWFEAS